MGIGIKIIEKERNRQVKEEGWTSEHDDSHINGELIDAAACYLAATQTTLIRNDAKTFHSSPPYNQGPAHWPWDKEWWKPSNDKYKNLVKAGALIAAEMDRFLREENKLVKLYGASDDCIIIEDPKDEDSEYNQTAITFETKEGTKGALIYENGWNIQIFKEGEDFLTVIKKAEPENHKGIAKDYPSYSDVLFLTEGAEFIKLLS